MSPAVGHFYTDHSGARSHHSGPSRGCQKPDCVRARAAAQHSDTAPSPRAAAEQAKGSRDLTAEIAALADAVGDLRAQPWYPIRPGDVVFWSIDLGDGQRYGETLVAVDDPDEVTESGAPLCKVSVTHSLTPGPGSGPVEVDEYVDFEDVWMEIGAGRVAVIRHGQLVHGALRRLVTTPDTRGGDEA